MDIKKILKNLKLHESAISMILGAIVIIVTGVLIINYFDGKTGDTIEPMDTESTISLPVNHIITDGEDLWKISEKYYGSGYNWVDIAKENNITDPDQITAGEELVIPDTQPRIAENIITPTLEPEIVIPTIIPQTGDQESKTGTHKVASGESLWNISEKYYKSGYNWVEIAEANNITNASVIEVGQELTIPFIEEKEATADEMTDPISGSSYTVIENDSLWDIAVRTYGDGYKWVEISVANDLTNPNIIHPGNILTIPR